MCLSCCWRRGRHRQQLHPLQRSGRAGRHLDAGFRLTRLVCEPEGVKKHCFDELVPQTSTWAIWWDEEASLIRYRCVRPPDIDEVVGTMTDDANIISGSVRVSG